MARFKDQAICIRLTDFSESSQVVTLLTQTHGKIRGLAKGARRLSPSSIAKFSGGFELLTAGQIVATTKASSDLATLTEWDLQRPNVHFRRNLQSQHLGLYAADVTNALLADHDPHEASYHALFRLLEELADPANHDKALLTFHWQLLLDAGYRLQLEQDIRTGQMLPQMHNYLFDAHAGGFTAQGAEGPGGGVSAAVWKVRSATLSALQAVAAGQDLTHDPHTLQRASKLLCVYVRAILDRELPTMKFILGDVGG